MSNIKEVLEQLILKTQDLDFTKAHPNTQQHHNNLDASLLEIKRIIEEAKPELSYEKLKPCIVCGQPQYNHSGDSHFDYATNQYQSNLLKALGDVYKDTDEEPCDYCKMKGREYTPECELNK